ncbi:hypothetical protein ACFOY4_40900 [Actinomadura syzygii]|uniref:SLATT domain-containing protein n=1 Tax=Actinomadura syzygii TaxID=1427538 RepID=A0A5D0UAJ4_9ACTN|nr:hypothetical protein [Actinomadura syzygii]TYC14692.1 hypothetical protein FXF65_17885 [Actinomadura syzygii]
MRIFPRRDPPPPQEQEVAVFLAEARRLLDYHWRRADAFERKALGVLAFTGVIVALLTPSLKTVLDLHGHYRTTALALGAAAITMLAGSAVSSAGALWARSSKSVNVREVRELWREYLHRAEHGGGGTDAWEAAGLQRNLVEKLLHGATEETSPIQSLCDDADVRGRWFLRGVWLNLTALLLILGVVVTTTLESL